MSVQLESMWESLKKHASAPVPGRWLPDDILMLLHFLVCSIGLANFAAFAAHCLYSLLATQIYIPYNEWAYHFHSEGKPEDLLSYAGYVTAAFVYFSAAYVVVYRKGELFAKTFGTFVRTRWIHLLLYAATLVVANGLTCAYSTEERHWVIAGLVWSVVLLFPIAYSSWRRKGFWEKPLSKPVWHYAWLVLLILAIVQLFSIFVPFFEQRIRLVDEFMDIPEKTLLNGTYVDNNEYINSHQIGGLLKYNPSVDRGQSPQPRAGTFALVPKTEALLDFIHDENLARASLLPGTMATNDKHVEKTDDQSEPKSRTKESTRAQRLKKQRGLVKPIISSVETSYYYNDALHALVLNRAMTIDELERLEGLFDNDQRTALQQLYFTSNMANTQRQKRSYTLEEYEFIKKNKFEIQCQVLNRWVVHHHNFVLSPINEYALGKPINEINMQYGFFNIVLMKYLLEKTGGITYQNYFRIWFAFWPLYFALFVIVSFVLLKNIRYVLACSLATFGAIQLINYKILQLGPGLNPLRHFFDVGIVCAFYFYMNRGRYFYLAISFLLCLLAVVNNSQFGYFILGALLMTLIIRSVIRRTRIPWGEIVGGVLTVLATALITWKASLGNDYMLHYYLSGFVSFPIDSYAVGTIAALFMTVGLVLVWGYDARHDLQDTAILLTLYSGATILYWIWGATINHFYNLAPILALSSAVLMKWGIETTALRHYARSMSTVAIGVILVVIYVPSLIVYYGTRHDYRKIFANHQVYQWNLDRAKLESTADPHYFETAVALIRKYTPQTNGIYIISKYDNFLPFLASRYSMMPFFDVPWFLITPTEIKMCVDRLKRAKPDYLFVDTDIRRSLNDDIVSGDDPMLDTMHDESVMRVQRLNDVKAVFRAVENDYEPVESSDLLMVLKRKAGH